MKRITLGLLSVGIFALGACNSSDNNTAAENGAGNSTLQNATHSDSSTVTMPADTNRMGSAANAGTAPATASASTLSDSQFMIKADQGGQNEIRLSKLALEKGVTGHAKTFANQMITDHTKAGNELKAIAQKKSVTLTGEMDPEHKTIHDQLSKLSGKQLEQAYMAQMVNDHKATEALLKSQIDNGQDTEVKAWASKTLPVVQQHTSMAEQHSKM